VFVSEAAVLHEIAPRRAKAVAEKVLGDHRPEVVRRQSFPEI
jgi:transposase